MVFQHVRTRDGAARNTYLSGSLFDDYGLDMKAMQADPAQFFGALQSDDRARLEREMTRSAEHLDALNVRVRLHIPSGDFIWLHIISQPHRLDDGAVVWDGIGLDVTREQEAEERLHQLATHDPLTDLPNTFQFIALLDRMLGCPGAPDTRIAVAQLSLARMVHINETYGFDAGDDLLCQAGERLRTQLGARGLLARGHGNTFLVAMEAAGDDPTLSDLLGRLQAAFHERFHVGEEVAVRSDVRIGLAIHPADGESADALIRASGIALDRAKRNPDRNYEFHAAEQGRELHRRVQQEQSLRDAIEAGLFLPHFQPQVSLADGSLIGLEALARGAGTDGTPLSPGDFIPLAEETGLIVALGQQILEKVLKQIGDWTRAGHRVPPVAVNFSARQFRREDFESRLRETLEQSGVDPTTLVVELTESSLLQDFSRAEETMRSLAASGVRFAIDDFGTGFSSLSYLARLPFHTLKIDRSFVSAIDHDARQRAITEALVMMSWGLDLRVVAEGVETQEQARQLKRMGCHAAQGYLYARPIPAKDVLDWLE
jgi:diguanylate cyclase (GGDEF)-like protein